MIIKEEDKHSIQERKFKKLSVCEFTSDRKRMSIIVKDETNDKITLICKGADSEIEKLLEDKVESNAKVCPEYEVNKKFVEKAANEGLRTLFVATRTIDQKEYDEWKVKKD